MTYIVLFSEKYGYLENYHDGHVHHTDDFHNAANYKYLDEAMKMREFYNARYDEEYHIEVFSMD